MSEFHSDDFENGSSKSRPSVASSTLYNLIESMIALTDRNKAQHKLVSRDLSELRDSLQSAFNNFASETQRAYQQLRQEINGEKRICLALFNELLELSSDLEQISAARPEIPDTEEMEPLRRWAEAIDIQKRKVEAALARHGIVPYDAEIGAEYRPELHERVGTTKVEGLGPHLVAEQRERGYASQQPDFVLRRPRVLVSE